MSLNVVDQEVKRRYGLDVKEQAYWIHDIEKSKTEVETVSILIRELVRLESLIGNTSVLVLLNMMFTAGILIMVLFMAFSNGGSVDMQSAGKAVGMIKSLTGGK